MAASGFIGRRAMTRRRVLEAAVAAGVALPIGLASRAPATAATAAPAQLTLPPPTGPCRLGTVSLHLVDRSRPDPIAGPSLPSGEVHTVKRWTA
jgi:hypothetical protein